MLCGKSGLLFIFAFALDWVFIHTLQQYIDQVQGISFDECKTMCNKNVKCLSVRYIRRFSLCKIYDLRRTYMREPGTQIYLKAQINSNVGCKESKGNSLNCKQSVCPVPNINGAEMFGNLFHIGSNIQFECLEIRRSETIKCLPGGIWSANTLFCTSDRYSACEYPGSLAHGHLGTLAKFNESHARLHVSCDTGYSLHFQGDILCDISTGIWSGFDNFCCDQLWIANWTKIYSSPKGVKKFGIITLGLKMKNIDDINVCSTGIYINKDIYFNWDNVGITKINLTIIADDRSVAYMLFKGKNTTNSTWFSKKNLLGSSWFDLQPSTPVQEFSIVGMKGRRRWFVAKRAAYNDACKEDIGWFVVTWDYYPCGYSNNTGHRILYAKHGRSSRFIQSELGVADKFEIWIQN